MFWESHHYRLLWETSLTPSRPICLLVQTLTNSCWVYAWMFPPLFIAVPRPCFITALTWTSVVFLPVFPQPFFPSLVPSAPAAKGSLTNDNYIMFLLCQRLLVLHCFLWWTKLGIIWSKTISSHRVEKPQSAKNFSLARFIRKSWKRGWGRPASQI